MNFYITTNEIPGEFLRENLILIFSLVKITRCYGYIINRTFRGQMMSERNILVSRWCLYKKTIQYMAAWRYEISLRVIENISLVHLTLKFRITGRTCKISSL